MFVPMTVSSSHTDYREFRGEIVLGLGGRTDFDQKRTFRFQVTDRGNSRRLSLMLQDAVIFEIEGDALSFTPRFSQDDQRLQHMPQPVREIIYMLIIGARQGVLHWWRLGGSDMVDAEQDGVLTRTSRSSHILELSTVDDIRDQPFTPMLAPVR